MRPLTWNRQHIQLFPVHFRLLPWFSVSPGLFSVTSSYLRFISAHSCSFRFNYVHFRLIYCQYNNKSNGALSSWLTTTSGSLPVTSNLFPVSSNLFPVTSNLFPVTSSLLPFTSGLFTVGLFIFGVFITLELLLL